MGSADHALGKRAEPRDTTPYHCSPIAGEHLTDFAGQVTQALSVT